MTTLGRFPGIYAIESDQRDRLLEHLSDAGIHHVQLDGTSISDTALFYQAAADAFPLDPPLRGSKRNWDAFSDSLYNGLVNLGWAQVAIIWADAQEMANADLSGLIEVCIVMEHVIRDLQTSPGGDQPPVQLALILLGRGSGFGLVDKLFSDPRA